MMKLVEIIKEFYEFSQRTTSRFCNVDSAQTKLEQKVQWKYFSERSKANEPRRQSQMYESL